MPLHWTLLYFLRSNYGMVGLDFGLCGMTKDSWYQRMRSNSEAAGCLADGIGECYRGNGDTSTSSLYLGWRSTEKPRNWWISSRHVEYSLGELRKHAPHPLADDGVEPTYAFTDRCRSLQRSTLCRIGVSCGGPVPQGHMQPTGADRTWLQALDRWRMQRGEV